MNNNRYSLLFEPLKIGPVETKNRFYNVPHATGMGYVYANANIRYREIKAEGGWGVVSTEECMIHPSSDHTSSPCMRLWDEGDIDLLKRTADAVHKHNALFAVELAHSGKSAANRMTREYPLGPSVIPYTGYGPYSTRAMDKTDIKNFRTWHKIAATRAMQAGADIVYVYCGHELSLMQHFLSRKYNRRSDEYGGSLENRARLLKEVLMDTKEAVGHKCAVAIRFSVEDFNGEFSISSQDEARDVVEMLAELPDLWDVNVSDWSNDSGPSRFFNEGYQTEYTNFVKQVTSKPVVGVGRYTSPDAMVSLIKKGVVDLIGAARPSIADPFLPSKVQNDDLDNIRECIGCNICTSNVLLGAPIRCTQNPSIGVEWSRNWHPEKLPEKQTEQTVLVIGSGPAGLECAVTLGKRGYQVIVAEAGTEIGGRVEKERLLPGLSEWGRIIDYRQHQLTTLPNVDIYFDSRLGLEDIKEVGAQHVVVATGAKWRRDGRGKANPVNPVSGWDQDHVFSADDVMDNANIPEGPVIVFDDDHYYMGSVIAEKLASIGRQVTLVTPNGELATWSKYTLEFGHIQKRLAEKNIPVITTHNLAHIDSQQVTLQQVFSGEQQQVPASAVVMATSQKPDTELIDTLKQHQSELNDVGIETIEAIGDCVAPGPIVQAIHDGRRYAMEFDTPDSDSELPYKLERTSIQI